jgi:excisionase family DNA binding protein
MASHIDPGAHSTSTATDSSSASPRPRLASDAAAALWTSADVASYLKASLSFVYKVAETGRLPCLRVGSMLRFDPEVVRAFARGEVKTR